MPNKPNVLLPALYGGIIMGVVSAVPGLSILNCFCCAGIMLGGFMAVFFYKKDLSAGMSPLTSADGVKLGALAGVFGAIITIILGKMIYALMGGVESEIVLNMLDSVGVRNSLPPEALSQLEHAGDPMGFLQIVSNFILCPLFGLLGGLIGYAVLKGKQAPPVPPAPVQM
jgi:hypothetical protein